VTLVVRTVVARVGVVTVVVSDEEVAISAVVLSGYSVVVSTVFVETPSVTITCVIVLESLVASVATGVVAAVECAGVVVGGRGEVNNEVVVASVVVAAGFSEVVLTVFKVAAAVVSTCVVVG